MARGFSGGGSDILTGRLQAKTLRGPWTVGAWVYPVSTDGGPVFEIGNSAGGRFHGIQMYLDFSLRLQAFQQRSGGNGWQTAPSSHFNFSTLNHWYFVAATFNGRDDNNALQVFSGDISTGVTNITDGHSGGGGSGNDFGGYDVSIGNYVDSTTPNSYDGRIFAPFYVPWALVEDEMDLIRTGDLSPLIDGIKPHVFFGLEGSDLESYTDIGFPCTLTDSGTSVETDPITLTATSNGPLTDPSSVPDNVIWLDADNAGSFSYVTGNEVDVWADESGNGLDIDNNEGPSGSTRDSGVLNGKAVVSYHDTRLSRQAGIGTRTQPITIFLVAQTNADPGVDGGQPFYAYDNSGSYISMNQRDDTVNGVVYPLYVDAGGSGDYPANTFPISTSVPYIFTNTYDDTGFIQNSAGRLSFITKYSGVGLGGAGSTGGIVYVGGNAGSGGMSDGFVAEFISYDRLLTSTEIGLIESYLFEKWFATTITDPTDITGCQVWLDFDDAGTLTLSTDEITQVDDKSGNGFDFILGVGMDGPTYTPATLNGRGVAMWNANNTGLRNDTLDILQPSTVFMILYLADVASAQQEYILVGPSADGTLGIEYHPVNDGSILVDTGSPNYPANTFEIDEDIPYYMSFVISGHESDARVNGSVGFSGIDDGSSDITGPITLGRANGTEKGLGNIPGSYIGEVIVYSRILDVGEIEAVETYLYDKWFGTASVDETVTPSVINVVTTVPSPSEKVIGFPAVVSVSATIQAPVVKSITIPSVVSISVTVLSPTKSDTDSPTVISVVSTVPTPTCIFSGRRRGRARPLRNIGHSSYLS